MYSDFESEEELQNYARKRVNQIFEGYPNVMRLDPGELIDLHKTASEHVTEAIGKRIGAAKL